MSKLDRWSSNEIAFSRFTNGSHYDNREWCRSEDVAELEAKYEQLRSASFELVFWLGVTPVSANAAELTTVCNKVLALVDPLNKQTKSEEEGLS